MLHCHQEPSGSQAPAPNSRRRPATRSNGADRQRLLLLHLPQVRLVAKSIWDRMRFAVDLEDLVGYGVLGLVDAVDRFDPSRGILLKTYAEHRIRGAILDGLRGMDWLPRSARQRERLRRRQDAASASAPVEPPRMESVFPGGNLTDLEKLAESRSCRADGLPAHASPEALYETKERGERLREAVAHLPRRHRQVIELYYKREMSMKQIGAVLHVHESRVSQLHASALRCLRRFLSRPCSGWHPQRSRRPNRPGFARAPGAGG
jgi:RNA polymerase sigma factor for flagellar operon FliA